MSESTNDKPQISGESSTQQQNQQSKMPASPNVTPQQLREQLQQPYFRHHMTPQQQQQMAAILKNIDPSMNNLTPEQTVILQQIHNLQTIGMFSQGFPRPTIKRRKPVKWETWEETNLIEGVRRFGRGNWAQIRAAFKFNQCRTNVDLHDKWRVLTGERKRARGAPRVDEILGEARRIMGNAAQKVQAATSPTTDAAGNPSNPVPTGQMTPDASPAVTPKPAPPKEDVQSGELEAKTSQTTEGTANKETEQVKKDLPDQNAEQPATQKSQTNQVVESTPKQKLPDPPVHVKPVDTRRKPANFSSAASMNDQAMHNYMQSLNGLNSLLFDGGLTPEMIASQEFLAHLQALQEGMPALSENHLPSLDEMAASAAMAAQAAAAANPNVVSNSSIANKNMYAEQPVKKQKKNPKADEDVVANELLKLSGNEKNGEKPQESPDDNSHASIPVDTSANPISE